MKTAKITQSNGFCRVQATVGVTGIRPAKVGALEKYCIVTVEASDGTETQVLLDRRLDWELIFLVYTGMAEENRYISAGLCHQSFTLKMLENALF